MNEILVPTGKIQILDDLYDYYNTVEDPWFLAIDIATALEYNSSNAKGNVDTRQMMKAVPDDEKLTVLIGRSGQTREMWMLKEFGLYEVLFK